jgi:hypothetical protein
MFASRDVAQLSQLFKNSGGARIRLATHFGESVGKTLVDQPKFHFETPGACHGSFTIESHSNSPALEQVLNP